MTLSASSQSTVTADWATRDGDATAGKDYVAARGSLTFNAGETSKTTDIRLLDDSVDDPTESFFVDFSNVTNALATELRIVVGAGGYALPSIDIDGTTITEGNEGVRYAKFLIALSRSSSTPVTMSYTTKDGTATAGTDYVATQSTLTFAPGERSKFVVVPILEDSVAEGDESFIVVLSDASWATIDTTEATCTILDDDGPTRRRPARRGSS